MTYPEIARLTDEAGMHCLEAHAAAKSRDHQQATFHMERAHDLLRDAQGLLETDEDISLWQRFQQWAEMS